MTPSPMEHGLPSCARWLPAGGLACLLLTCLLGIPPIAEADVFHPNTMRVGSLEIHPSFSSDVTYNTNISLTNDKVPDVIFRQAPGLLLQWGRLHVPVQRPRLGSPHGLTLDYLLDLYLTRYRSVGDRGYLGKPRPQAPPTRQAENAWLSSLRFRRVSFVLDYRPLFINLVDNPGFNSIDHELAFAADVRLPAGFYLRLDNNFLSSNAINNYRREVANFTALQRAAGIGYHTNLLAATLGYNFYADYAAFVSLTDRRFFLRNVDPVLLLPGDGGGFLPPVGIEGVDAQDLGLIIQTVGFTFSARLSPKTTLSAGYLLGRLHGNQDAFDIRVTVGDERLPFLIGFDVDPRNAVFHELRLGFQRVLTARRSLFGQPVPKTVLKASFGYQWRTFADVSLLLGRPDGSLLAFPILREDFREFLFDLEVSSQIRPRTLVRFVARRFPREAEAGSGNVSIHYQAGMSVRQGIRRKWSLSAFFLFRYGQHDAANRPFEESRYWEAGAQVGYRIQEWLEAGLLYHFLARNGDFDYNTFESQRVRFRILLSF